LALPVTWAYLRMDGELPVPRGRTRERCGASSTPDPEILRESSKCIIAAARSLGRCSFESSTPTRQAHPYEHAIVTPTESDYLFRLATLSLSFVGFSAVVVTLRGALGGELSVRHLRLVRLYIEGGFLVTFLALVPNLLNLLHIPDTITWPLSSAAAATIFTFLLVIQFRRRRAVEPGPFPAWVVIINAISIVAVASLWLNVAGIPFPPSVGPYAVTLTWALCIFGFIFVRTIELFLHRSPPP